MCVHICLYHDKFWQWIAATSINLPGHMHIHVLGAVPLQQLFWQSTKYTLGGHQLGTGQLAEGVGVSAHTFCWLPNGSMALTLLGRGNVIGLLERRAVPPPQSGCDHPQSFINTTKVLLAKLCRVNYASTGPMHH